ncbi:MAG: hypothetical protein Q9M35_12840 [Rhodothermus sp.]|nr:hypothetical protein [Rhodothermus sp.]
MMRDVLLVCTGVLFGIAAPIYYAKLKSDPWQQWQWRNSQTELLLVYIGSPTCGPSNDPTLPEMLATARQQLASLAAQQHISFRAVGLAISRNVRMGLDHLEKMGPFHEIATGARWENLAFKHVQFVAPGLRATPQIVILERRNHTTRLLLRRVGLRDIRQWVHAGIPLPRLTPTASRK